MKRGWIEYRNLKTPKTDLEIILAKDPLCTSAAPAWFSLYKELCACVCVWMCECAGLRNKHFISEKKQQFSTEENKKEELLSNTK